MSMHGFSNAGPIMAGLAAWKNPAPDAAQAAPSESVTMQIGHAPAAKLWHLSVPVCGVTMHAVVLAKTESEARARTHADDDCWRKPEVEAHDCWRDDLEFIGSFPKPEAFAPSSTDIIRMIENVADQVSEIAAQMVDIRKRLDALEKYASTLDRRTVGQQLYGGIPTGIGQSLDSLAKLQSVGLNDYFRDALQAQSQQSGLAPIKRD